MVQRRFLSLAQQPRMYCMQGIPYWLCHSNVKGETKHAGVVEATDEEKRYTARNVEIFRCNNCGRHDRFPRYNDPIKLLSTRRGRCGEFANVFTLTSLSNKLVFCSASPVHRRTDSMGMEFRGSCMGRVFLDCSKSMDTFRSLRKRIR